MKLPELPEPSLYMQVNDLTNDVEPLFTADQLREYGRQCAKEMQDTCADLFPMVASRIRELEIEL